MVIRLIIVVYKGVGRYCFPSGLACEGPGMRETQGEREPIMAVWKVQGQSPYPGRPDAKCPKEAAFLALLWVLGTRLKV